MRFSLLILLFGVCYAADFEGANPFSPLTPPTMVEVHHVPGDILRPVAIPSWKWSMAAVVAANAADVASSWHRRELNPVLGAARPFGARQLAIKGGVTGAALLAEVLIVKRWPKSARVFRILNFADATVSGAVAVQNWRTR